MFYVYESEFLVSGPFQTLEEAQGWIRNSGAFDLSWRYTIRQG